ncbi:Endocytosis and vacuole integrity protein [Kalmusia sp. IMI 367209]|nr:Endocytosis and vacuole integrity protein [Kalmusia sp. IMI 367209]
MTAQILAAELGNLIQDSKRKNTELRNAAEKALQDLKSLPITSEAQLSAGNAELEPDLSRRPHFISPFLIACNTRNAKFGSTGISCLQRLSVSKSLPRERLTEVLDALKDSVSLSNVSCHDVQLKILQTLPSLVQNYPVEIRSESLSTVLHICSALQNAKNFAVSNTAAATLQQLVIAIFDRVATEDEKSLEIPTVTEVPADDVTVSVRPAAHDAFKVFNDLNLLITGEKTGFIRFSPIPSTSILEVIEAILSNHAEVMTTHAEQIHILRSLLMPTIIRSLSDRLSFPITLRIIRILNLLIRNHLTIMPSECEIALGLLNHMLDPEASSSWKRALCLEVFRGIYSDSRLLLQIYSHFDEQEGKKNIFGDNLASFVRLATERPAVIGLGQQTSLPANRNEGKDSASDQAVAEAGALAGVIGGPMTETNTGSHPAGISMQWSTLKTPCIEHLDKAEPPALPETYIYSLVLTCITNVSESLAKFVLPLTVHNEGKSKRKTKTEENPKSEQEAGSPTSSSRRLSRAQSFRKKTIPVNPLSLEDHPAYAYVQTSATLVNECWPAILATCSTFLNAALDTDYYRALVRAIQKVTQVAGLLVLSTPRDAFLTTLAKAAVPSSMVLANVASPKSPPGDHSGTLSNAKALLNVDNLMSQASSALEKNRRPSHDVSFPLLGARNLLCLRALLNLAIALGPTLHSAWSIVFETLQVADLVMAFSNQGGLRTPGGSGSRSESYMSSEKIEAETSAVQAAARRLFESTVDFPNESFVEVLQALCGLIQTGSSTESGEQTPSNLGRPKVLHQRRLGSVSGMSLSTDSNSRDSAFALNKIGELAGLNEERLASYPPDDSGWDILVTELVRYSVDNRKATATRLLAADILCRTVKEVAEISISEEERNEVQARVLSALQKQISSLYQDGLDYDSYTDTDARVHQIALESMKSVIEHCGESLVAGWVSVFGSLLSVFSPSSPSSDRATSEIAHKIGHLPDTVEVISKSLARTAFGTVQLVCSDFLAAVPETSLSTLLELLLQFSCQQEDLNMSLTAVTFFWNVSDFLHARSDLSQLPTLVNGATEQEHVPQIVKMKSKEGNTPALWLQVLLNLSTITTDKRAELRNSAIQSIQRIFENYVDQLSPEAWMLCLRSVLFGMVGSNIAVQNQIRTQSASTDDEIAAWNDTTNTVLSSISKSISMYMIKMDDATRLGEAWSDLLDHCQRYFNCGSHALGASVFNMITEVLSRMDSEKALGTQALLKTANIWTSYFDQRESWDQRPEDNQEAFVAYAEAFKAIYRLTDKCLFLEDLIQMLRNLEACVVESHEAPYSSDVDHMTTLQARVIECVSIVRTDNEKIPQFLLRTLSSFTVLPYSSLAANPEKRSPTFVALSKASMTLLQSIIVKHVADEEIYKDGAVHLVLSSLEKPIREKYIWQREGKLPTIWQKATSTAVAILEPTLPYINKLETEPLKSLWTQIIAITNGVTRAQLSTCPPTLGKDEVFDIDAFTKLRSLITLPLGSSTLPDSLRRTYTRNLFETSILHAPAPSAIPDLTNSPLEELYKVHLGRTDDPTPTFRPNISYACLSELFTLVAVHDSSPARIKLAQAAAPYLILRAALPLRAYIADHPLRGRMPQPESQRRELLFVLRELGKLESETAAIPDAEGVKSRVKKHLHRVYPLLVKAMRVSRGDVEVFEGLVGLVDMVGLEFGVLDE